MAISLGILECLRKMPFHTLKTDESYSNSEIGTNWNIGMSTSCSNIPNRSKNSIGICLPAFYRLKWRLAGTFQLSNPERENEREAARGLAGNKWNDGSCVTYQAASQMPVMRGDFNPPKCRQLKLLSLLDSGEQTEVQTLADQ